MAKYLVVGGAGFIGSHLVDELVKEGHKVNVLDNLSTGKKANLNPKAKFIKADITKLAKIQPAFKNIDGVFHLAALPRVQLSIDHPAKTHDANVNGTLNILIAARDAKVKRVVYSASSSAYGDSQELPLKETATPRPMSPYGLQKYIGEEYCRLFAKLYGMETVSLRYFNVYGSRMADTGAYLSVIRTFLQQRAANTHLTITGDGEQTRAFTHVSDVVRANLLAMASKKVGNGEVINTGSEKNFTVNYVAKLVGGPVKYIESRIEPKHSQADHSLAKKLLGWSPKISLEKGIKELLQNS
jgi:UDP-glucose 4-epimerase